MDTKVIKPGVVESGRRIKGGFNLNKFVKELLRSMGFAVTEDCCTYYPSAPQVVVANVNNITAEEVAGVPIYGLFIAFETENAWSLNIKTSATGWEQIVES